MKIYEGVPPPMYGMVRFYLSHQITMLIFKSQYT